MSDDTDLNTPPITSAARPFKEVADETPEVDSHSAGYTVMQEMGDQAARDKDKKKANGFFRKASGGGAGFTLAGTDADGNGFNLPLTSPELLGGKWVGVHRKWMRSDQHAMQYAPQLNRSFDKIIKRALKNNWTHIGLQIGMMGKIEAPGPLNRALNRRLQELASGADDRAIKAMGFRPEMVRAQLGNMQAHSGHIKEVMEAIQQRAAPTVTPP